MSDPTPLRHDWQPSSVAIEEACAYLWERYGLGRDPEHPDTLDLARRFDSARAEGRKAGIAEVMAPGELNSIHKLRAEVGELRAVLDNERGEGEPPSRGWTFYDTSWTRGDSTRGPWLHVGGPDRYGDPWTWSVTKPCDCARDRLDEWPTVAKGTAPTARTAMRAADEVLNTNPVTTETKP